MNFQQPYNRSVWQEYLRKTFLPDDYDTSAPETVNLDYQPSKISQTVKFLGSSSALSLSVYEMQHPSPNDPRITISRDAFNFVERYKVKNALIFFISESSDNYRLSLITRELVFKDKKVTSSFTNPKRFSYLLGPDIKMHTVEENISKKGRVRDEADLKSRFSIEIVNKEFYREIADKFSRLVGGKRGSGTNAVAYSPLLTLPSGRDQTTMREFTVRMVGRIVFCWFLKKKRSAAGIPLIPEEILSSAAVRQNPDYYHKILEPLFFEVMNKRQDERRPEIAQNRYFHNIPFLNGGLFDPHIHQDFYDFNEAMNGSRHCNTLKIPDNWFLSLFSILELYNFTIDENTPVDIDISVDPEMLGRIFENLLAEINPETEETARKNTGSYYTPRPIVEYMVDASLTQYLLTSLYNPYGQDSVLSSKNHQSSYGQDSVLSTKLQTLLDYTCEGNPLSKPESDAVIAALDKVRIIDPACGSGAFPMGILQKMLLIRQKVDPESIQWVLKQLELIPNQSVRKVFEDKLMGENWDYKYKMSAILHSIYGIDIQPIAVEIAKLRFFLTLMVEETIDDGKPNRGINPLPNLSFKFVAADSLSKLGEFAITQTDWMVLQMYKECISELEKLRESYFYADTNAKKEQIQKEFQQTQKQLSEFITSLTPAARKLALWNPFCDEQTDWFDPQWMFGLKPEDDTHGVFDIVIGNPPYIQLQKNSGKLAEKYQHQGYETFNRTGDIYCLFYENGIRLLRNNGILTFITSNKWMRAGYGEKLRTFFSCYNPLQLIDMGPGVFESATVDSNILVIQNSDPQNLLHAVTYEKTGETLNRFISRKAVIMSKLSNAPWYIGSNLEQQLKEKIERLGKPLKDWDVNIYYGIKTGLNEAFVISTVQKDQILSNCLTADERHRTEQIIKPLLRGRDIKRYSHHWASKWLIGTHNGYTDSQGNHISPIDINLYPALKQHLDQFHPKLEMRYDQGKTPYNLRDCAYYPEFEKEKIVWAGVGGKRIEMSLVPVGMYIREPANFMTGRHLQYLIGILHSNLIVFFYDKIKTEVGKGTRFYVRDFLQIPIPEISASNKDIASQIEQIADDIQGIKQDVPFAETSDLEQQIDRLVYQLYDLTPDEIALIEKEENKR